MTTSVPTYAWLNGELVDWADCVLHARSQGAFWGANVFEGIRAYVDPDGAGMSLFRLDEHLARLRRSMKTLHMPVDHTDAELTGACQDLLLANDFRADAHVCVVAYFDHAPNFDSLAYTQDTGVHITALPKPRSAAYERGISACVASWRRISDDSMPPRVKTGANYHNSRLAQHEATRNGFDTSLLLNQRGTVSEAPSSCVLMVRDGELVTPPATSGVLEGITVATVAELAERQLGLPLRRREIDRTELYAADELFLCGTLSELMPITSVDRLPVAEGVPGPITLALQRCYDDLVRGRAGRSEWRTPVRAARAEVAR